jgi:hypothetical protein
MSWFSKKSSEEFRLLDKRTPAGGIIFWVKDQANVHNDQFVEKMLMANMKKLPTGFLALISGGEQPMTRHVHPLPGGECEIHLDFKVEEQVSSTARNFQNPASAAKALCDVVLRLPALSADEIARQLETITGSNHTLTRAGRSVIEPLVDKALALTASSMVAAAPGAKHTGWQVDTAEAKQGAFVFTLFRMPDGKESALPLFAWRGNDGRIYSAIHTALAPALGLK